MRRALPCVCALLVVWCAAAAAQKPPAAPASVVLTTSGPAMLAVARLIVEDTWNPILDKRVQDAAAGQALGPAWTSADPRWQKARAALGTRMTRIFESYGASAELAGHVRTAIGKIGATPDLDAAVTALRGSAGAAVVRFQARQNFIISVMTARPDGPAIGSPQSNARMKELGERFDDRIGRSLPPDDGSHKAEVERLATSPAWATLSRVWTSAVSNATRQLDTAMNLMLFDNQAAVDREIAAAVGPAASRAQAAGSPRDTFSLERMATCKDSWLEWGNDDARVGAFRDGFRAQFTQKEGDPFFVPIASATLLGMPVASVYSSTIGMARGFSVAVNAPFDTAKKNVEKSIGASLKDCETSDGMHTCHLQLAEKKTVMLMADATGREKTTLVGCYYFYEK